jgi:uncharacterized protein
MSARFVIDALDFVHNAGAHHGKIAPAELERLQDYLTDSHGGLEYAVSGVLGGDNPVLRVVVKGTINLQCQRCLAGLAHELDLKADILLARNESELSRFDEDDSVDGVLAVPEMDVLALIEDEIILSLPISPRHPAGECSIGKPAGDAAVGREHPFAALVTLKKPH